MSTFVRLLAFGSLGIFLAIPGLLRAQPAVAPSPFESAAKESTPSTEASKSEERLAGQEDLDAAMDLKVDADDIDKNTKVIERIEQAIKKGLPEADMGLAKELLASSALDRAKLQLQEMIKAGVGETMARRVQRKVLSDLELAVKNDPKLGEAHLLLAKLMLSMGSDTGKAKEALNAAIEHLAYDLEKRGEAYAVRSLLQKEDDGKLADLRQAMRDIPKSVEVQRTLFALLIDRGRFEDVYELGKELLDENEKNPIAMQATITALLELDRDDEAIALLDKRLKSDDDTSVIRLIRANVYMEMEKYDEAIADATEVIVEKPNNIEALFVRARAYLQKTESLKAGSDSEFLTQARRDVDSALDIKPNAAEGIRLRALIASQQKRYDEAIQDITLLAKNNPRDPIWLLQLATLYQLNDQPSMATKVADQIVLVDNKNWRAYRIRGDAKLSVGDQKAAAEDYRKALEFLDEKNEERSGLLNNLAWLLATSTEDALRDGTQSIIFGKEACEITEYKEVHILSTLAAGYAETGNFEEAIKWSSKAVELGAQENHEQLEQLQKELDSYKEGKPWREKQEVKENKPPLIRPEETIET